MPHSYNIPTYHIPICYVLYAFYVFPAKLLECMFYFMLCLLALVFPAFPTSHQVGEKLLCLISKLIYRRKEGLACKKRLNRKQSH